MSLYGALFSGVSGLTSQSNRIGIISDNISNVNTIGYKGGSAQFQSLVTTAASSSSYSPGGVIGGNRQQVDKQGLLQSTDSSTDIAISGEGFFAVNTAADQSGQVLFTRAGSFRQDSTGNFKNSGGFFLQAWPLDRDGRLPGEAGNINTTSNANLSSLRTVNVQNLTGVAASTSTVAIGANLNSATSIFPGTAGTAAFDSANAVNFGIKAKDIIVPDSLGLTAAVNHIERGDKFTVSTGGGLTYTYRYGGFTYGRNIIAPTGSGVGDNARAVQPASDTIGPEAFGTGAAPSPTGAAPLEIISKTGAGPYTSIVRVTSTAHGLSNGDAITYANVPATIGAITAAEFNTTHLVSNVTTNTYDITVVSAADPTVAATGGGTNVITSTVQPFATTDDSTTVLVRQADHGLVTGEVVTISGVSSAINGIPITDLNDKFIVTVIDDDHYQISVETAATASGGGGNASTTVNMRPFTGGILDATDPTKIFISGDVGSGHNINDFTAAAKTFEIATGSNTYTFTYTSSSPNAQLGQFNNLNTLATAINSVATLSARIVNNRLFVSAVDANAALSFTNGSNIATGSGSSIQSGIDWVRELGLAQVAVGTDRFSSLQSLASLVNNSSGLSASISNPVGAASLDINADDPLTTITFADRSPLSPTTVTLSASVAPFTMTAGSGAVQIAHASHGYTTGDVIEITTTGGPYNGLTDANLTGLFTIRVIDTNTYEIIANSLAEASTSVTNPAGPLSLVVTQPINSGSVVTELGLVDHAAFGSGFTARSTGPLGPAYGATDSTKNMSSGSIPPQFSRPLRVFDALGTGHDLTVAFIKTAVNTWAVEVYAVPADDIISSLPNGQIANGIVTFNGDGSLFDISAGLTQELNITWTNGAVPSDITFDWGTAGEPFGTPGATNIGKSDGLSQFNSDFKVNFVNQNGAPVGDLLGVTIDENGFVVASFNNGETQRLFKIPLAKFANPNQMEAVSGNVYAQSSLSGEVNLRQPGSSGVGKIAPSSLEQSNVELAGQLTDMIVAQRSYQANTKVISTADNLLEALNQIIR
jgi:flagellar hook-basal body protein